MIFNNIIMTKTHLRFLCLVFHAKAKDTSLILNIVLYTPTSSVYEIATHTKIAEYFVIDFWHPLFLTLANVETCKLYWWMYSNQTFEWYLSCIIHNYMASYLRSKRFPDWKFVRNSPRLPYISPPFGFIGGRVINSFSWGSCRILTTSEFPKGLVLTL